MRHVVGAGIVASLSVGVLAIACSGPPTEDGRGNNPLLDGGGTSSSSSGSSGASSGSSGSSGEVNTSPPAGAGRDYCDQTIGKYLAYYESCCGAADKDLPQWKSAQQLFTFARDACRNDFEGSVSRGRVYFDPAGRAACQARYDALAACDATQLSESAGAKASEAIFCPAAVVGKQPVGAPCRQPYECVKGATCVGYNSEVDGTCQAPPTLGARCGRTNKEGGGEVIIAYGEVDHPECAAGLRCGPDDTCIAREAEGGECGRFFDTCREDLTCHLQKCGAQGPTGPGTPCLEDIDCAKGSYCAGASGTTQGTCTAKKATGACSSDAECTALCGGAGADAGGTCRPFCTLK